MNEQPGMMNQQQQLMNMNRNLLNMPQPPMVPMNRSYGMWGQQQQFQNPNLSSDAMKPPPPAFSNSLGPRRNWKGKRVNKPIDKRRMEQQQSLASSGGIGGGSGNPNFRNYNPPTLNELQHQNWLKTRKTFTKKKSNKSMSMNMAGNGGRSAPFAPRNTTSFLIRAKRSGGIAPVVSPFPVTPSVLPTPILSPSTEVLGNMAKEEWGVDGYGSMKGLIRLRSIGHEDEEEDEGGSSESDMEEHVEVERRLDHDLSRFEMIYDPNSGNAGGMEHHNILENRVDDQDSHIAQLEEENLNLKERLFLMEGELGDLRRRLLLLERRGGRAEEVESENEREMNGEDEDTHSTGENDENLNDQERIEGRFDHGFEAAEGFCVEGKLQSGDEEIKMSNKNDNESSEADKSAAQVETAEDVADESCKLVVETVTCMLESEVSKEDKLGC
ncbi:uncharacterized protein LOC130993724 [Salvia miltiorrhiza]|uniref:uncharacterized protein LOC130993724 n=1 Tax=Salvia miltiorrhiza TaxID=226208 RepID=UPI0025AD7F33|nr:uncharacterized protein LOC130993724 [Salvia miltiorrhiza]